MKNTKRIMAIIGILLLILLPIILIISAILATKESNTFFVVSLYSIVVIPIILYGYILINRLVNKDKIDYDNLFNQDESKDNKNDIEK
ncbi:MAG TPA: hypothetical protein GXZ90_10135 [Clostridiales bacterium]|nr:hypothetical protein [Clostridiales bacterium]